MRHLITLAAIACLALTTACAGAQKKADPVAKAEAPAKAETAKAEAPAKAETAKAGAPAATAGTKTPCGADCAKGCADCANPNKTAAVDSGVKMMTGADLGDKIATTTKCVVSGRELTPTATTQVAMYQGKAHYFCCGGCAGKFAKNPAKFAAK